MNKQTIDKLDRQLERLAQCRDDWVRVSLDRRIGYLRRCIDSVVAVAADWVAEACRRKGIDPASAACGEEWISGPMTTVRNLRLFAAALQDGGRPAPRRLRTAADGRQIADVFPRTQTDRFLYYNMSAEVWIAPGKPATQGRIYREPSSSGGVSLVLGAGNVPSIAPLDVAHKLFVDDQVVMLKMNPVNAYLKPFFERAFSCLVDDGYLQLADGANDVGEYLCGHALVDAIHLTGSDKTYDAIRRAVDKPMTAELGCVTPVIVVPGRWSAGAVDFQARHVASMVAHNASFNCNAAKVLVLSRDWPQRAAFLGRLRAAMAAAPPRRAYYPGANERYRAFCEQYPRAEVLGAAGDGVVPWTLIPDVPGRSGEYALCNEAFCGVLAETRIEAADTADFLERAVDLVNEHVWGSLSCVLLVDPSTQRRHAGAIERSLERLRYGNVGLNVWTGVNFGIGVTSWGAYPGHRDGSIGSGKGTVHNTLLYDHPEKSIVRAPFRIRPKPVWFADHRNLRALGRALTRFEAHPGPASLLPVAYAGLWG